MLSPRETIELLMLLWKVAAAGLISLHLVLMGAALYLNLRYRALLPYLREHRHGTWRELTSLGRFRLFYHANGLRFLRYLYSDRDADDAFIHRTRQGLRRWVRRVGLVLAAELVLVLVLLGLMIAAGIIHAEHLAGIAPAGLPADGHV